MAHKTKQNTRLKEQTNRQRVQNGFNTGTRNMGYSSNQERKAALHKFIHTKAFYTENRKEYDNGI